MFSLHLPGFFSPRFFSMQKIGTEHGHFCISFQRLAIFCKVDLIAVLLKFVVFFYYSEWSRSLQWLLHLAYIYFAAFLSWNKALASFCSMASVSISTRCWTGYICSAWCKSKYLKFALDCYFFSVFISLYSLDEVGCRDKEMVSSKVSASFEYNNKYISDFDLRINLGGSVLWFT